jgi:hypothetical protein
MTLTISATEHGRPVPDKSLGGDHDTRLHCRAHVDGELARPSRSWHPNWPGGQSKSSAGTGGHVRRRGRLSPLRQDIPHSPPIGDFR